MNAPPRRPVVPLGTVVARRDLRTRAGATVTLSVGTPVHVGDGWGWACPFRIEGFPRVVEGQVFGVDAMQALQRVTPALRRELERSSERQRALDPRIRAFVEADEDGVVDLWQRCELTRPWNDPRQDIRRKLTTQPELFLVLELDGEVVGSAMGGFDGHRGWVNYVAVAPGHRKRGFGSCS